MYFQKNNCAKLVLFYLKLLEIDDQDREPSEKLGSQIHEQVCQVYLTLSRESGNIICIRLHNLSFLHDMMFKLDFEALYLFCAKRNILSQKVYS